MYVYKPSANARIHLEINAVNVLRKIHLYYLLLCERLVKTHGNE